MKKEQEETFINQCMQALDQISEAYKTLQGMQFGKINVAKAGLTEASRAVTDFASELTFRVRRKEWNGEAE